MYRIASPEAFLIWMRNFVESYLDYRFERLRRMRARPSCDLTRLGIGVVVGVAVGPPGLHEKLVAILISSMRAPARPAATALLSSPLRHFSVMLSESVNFLVSVLSA